MLEKHSLHFPIINPYKPPEKVLLKVTYDSTIDSGLERLLEKIVEDHQKWMEALLNGSNN